MSIFKKLGILGCGWLGSSLLEDPRIMQAKATCVSQSSLETLKTLTQWAYQLDIYADPKDWPRSFFHDIDTLMILVPFRRNLSDPWVYPQAIKTVLDLIQPFPISRVIFSSSTGVYPNRGQIVQEADQFEGDTDREKALLAAESLILNSPYSSTIYRLGGLVGKQRHPGRFLAKHGIVNGATNPVNLIHLQDLIEAIFFIESLELKPDIINIVSPEKPSKSEFYRKMAQDYQITEPLFSKTPEPYKNVSSDRLLNLGFSFKYSNPLSFKF